MKKRKEQHLFTKSWVAQCVIAQALNLIKTRVDVFREVFVAKAREYLLAKRIQT